jgi:hypothetical protein
MVRIRRKKDADRLESPNSEGLRRRAKKFSEEELIDGAEILLNNLVFFIPEFRRSRNLDMLGEVKMTAESLYILAETLLQRADEPLVRKVATSRQVKGF